jgi:hypothetical protein
VAERAPALSDQQLFILEMAGAIVASRASVLEEDELETLAETAHLLGRYGREAPLSQHHWTVVRRTVGQRLAGGFGPDLHEVAA